MHSSFYRLRATALAWLLLWLAAGPLRAQGQQGASQEPPRYEIGGINVTGTRYLDPNTMIGLTGLKVGDKISIPGDDLGRAIRKLWDQGILGDVNVVIDRFEGQRVFLTFDVKERPRLSKIYFTNISKTQADELRNKVKIVRGKVVTDALLNNTRQAVRKFYTDKGFMNVKVGITQEPDSSLPNSVELVVDVRKGDKVRISDISFVGNEAISDGKLKGKMKKTKEKKAYKFLNSGKFQRADFEADKEKILDFYNAQGYRDAIITSDSLITVQDEYSYRWIGTENGKFGIHKATVREADKLVLRVYLDEGPKYYFRNITWSGNYLYDSKTLSSVLGIKEGSVYSKETLDKRLNYNPTGQDVTSLYMNDGYLFFSIDPVETRVEGDSIDIEMRLSEGVQARIKDINIAGNTKTSDHVIRRELRTLPGDKFNRELLIRSQREISSLGYFDPEKVGLNPVPNPADGTVDINYTVSEKPSDQITLSGGWGGYAGFIGTVGLVFNNFSLRKASDFHNWRPVPGGDGQRLGLNIQANGLQYQSYSFSFTEPWLGGRKPNSFSVSLNKSIQRTSTTGSVLDIKNGSYIKVNSATVSLGRRLRWPDDYFTLSNSLSYSQYKLKDYPYFANFSTGNANNITFNTTLARNSTDNPTFTRRGSALSLSVNLTPPYSIFKGAHPGVNEWVEFHKWMFDASWFTPLVGKLVLNTRAHFGFIGRYNHSRAYGPFERFKLGGAGLGFGGASNFVIGTEYVGLRGYEDPNAQFAIPTARQGESGGIAYNKYVMELRYPVSLNPAATVYVLSFAEAGNAFDKYSDYNPYKLYRSAGVGARVFMAAFGLLGFDFGYGFDNVAPVAGAKQDKSQFHFIIGQQIR
ncbi:outer membrane protein assembly factor BamA [Hymenobacter busanensis]|uniref:Outer membrane protein assembly factor BamA n=1 Tax=Hymenobacter busanensis TaxID=2607656 RepID=A0A7L5A133_9BACT|nr:outer membrane protein assembly factor BamA [Hymenobacter busanensis]KAA9331541.1 outer membrane protein assembly factor BamA [Hymenobacter busanensis]QHJ08695.1 outer membrane protein assembly factor BamA [Hymenobacter busanensis]